jgi:hypothetical protein
LHRAGNTHKKKGRHKSNPKAGSLVGLGFRAGMGYKEYSIETGLFAFFKIFQRYKESPM